MSTGKSTFKGTDVRRAIKAIQAAGLEVLGVIIAKDGTIDVRTGKEEKHDDPFSSDEMIRKLREAHKNDSRKN
jgi:orotate phosphoribosyltransferase